MLELITENRELLGLIALLGVSVVINLVMHWAIVCTCLYRHGARFPTGLLFWRMFHELRVYRDVVSADARPPTYYYLGFILTWFNLLLAIAIVLRMLWFQSHPVGS